jgi:hypothetical protein
LYEITAGLSSLFPACYLQGTLQLQRVEPSVRGPPTFRLPERRPVFFAGSGGAAFERYRGQDALSAREAP